MKKYVILLVFIFVHTVCAQYVSIDDPLGLTLMERWFKGLDGQAQGPVVDENVLLRISQSESMCSAYEIRCDQESFDWHEKLKRYPGLGIFVPPYLPHQYEDMARDALKKVCNVDINLYDRVGFGERSDYVVLVVDVLRDGGMITFLISTITFEILSKYRYTKNEWENVKENSKK